MSTLVQLSPAEAAEDRGYILHILAIAVPIIATLAVLLRLLARGRTKASFAVDDWFILGSLAPLYGMSACTWLMASKGGVGRHSQTLAATEWQVLLKVLMATMITYATTITCVKISLLLLYRRIFSISRFRHVAALVGGLCIAWYLAALFADIFQCRPFSAAFEIQNLFTPKCIDEQAFYRGIITSNVILDVLVLAIPIAMVWRLQLKRSQKVSLSCIFLLGGFACVASLMRIATIGDIQHEDLSYNITNEYIWSEVEPAAAIICACIPTYKPLFKGLNFSFLSALSSGRRRRTVDANKFMNDSNDDGEHLQWCGTEGKRIKGFDGFMDDHRKLSKGKIHVVNIGMTPPKVYVREISDAV